MEAFQEKDIEGQAPEANPNDNEEISLQIAPFTLVEG